METYSFFPSHNGDRTYRGSDWADYFASLIGNGIIPKPEVGLQVVAGEGMQIIISPGVAYIGGYRYENTDNRAINLANADGVLKRIDRIVVRWDLAERKITAEVKPSAPASSPTAPELQRDADIYELCLADVAIAAGSMSIRQADITDRRYNTDLCGIVTGLIDQVDATELTAQLNDYMEQYEAESKEQFETWYNDVKDLLDPDAAGQLAAAVLELREGKLDKTWEASHNLQTYTALDQLGLSGLVTTAQVCEAMPAYSKLVLHNTPAATDRISDAPHDVAMITITRPGMDGNCKCVADDLFGVIRWSATCNPDDAPAFSGWYCPWESGTWTARLNIDGKDYITNTGNFIKFGDLVYIAFSIGYDIPFDRTGPIYVYGVPYASKQRTGLSMPHYVIKGCPDIVSACIYQDHVEFFSHEQSGIYTGYNATLDPVRATQGARFNYIAGIYEIA